MRDRRDSWSRACVEQSRDPAQEGVEVVRAVMDGSGQTQRYCVERRVSGGPALACRYGRLDMRGNFQEWLPLAAIIR
ncbi:MAG: hypothetical protein ACYC3X_14625 [Pirellulaceae bacterium]